MTIGIQPKPEAIFYQIRKSFTFETQQSICVSFVSVFEPPDQTISSRVLRFGRERSVQQCKLFCRQADLRCGRVLLCMLCAARPGIGRTPGWASRKASRI